MCSPAQCGNCGKTTWRGCGRHVDQVLARVPAHRRCACERPAAQRPSLKGLFRRGK